MSQKKVPKGKHFLLSTHFSVLKGIIFNVLLKKNIIPITCEKNKF